MVLHIGYEINGFKFLLAINHDFQDLEKRGKERAEMDDNYACLRQFHEHR